MDLYLSNRGKVKVSMIKYLEVVIKSFLEAITVHVDSPVAARLFGVREE